MGNKGKENDKGSSEIEQIPLFDISEFSGSPAPQAQPKPQTQAKPKKESKKLTIDPNKFNSSAQDSGEIIREGIPPLVLPTRWEYLQPKIEDNNVSLRTIIRPIPQAMNVVRDIVEYLKILWRDQIYSIC